MTHPDLALQIQQAAELIRSARHAVAITGAGMSTPSGIPDFRSAGSGLWTQQNPMQVASIGTFRRKPEVFFDWLRPLAAHIWQAQPNPAHSALAELEQAGFLNAVITQNIDGLHQRAGSQNVIEVHGSVNTLTCLQCRAQYPESEYRAAFIDEGQLPHCRACQAVLKPDITLFGEMMPVDAWDQAQNECEQADLVLVAGSSLEVSPANQLPLYALQSNAQLIINTLSPTYLDERADVLIREDVARALPLIAGQLHG